MSGDARAVGGRSRLEVEARERGRRCWSWSRRAVLWRWRGCGRCRGSFGLGDGQPVENAPAQTCSRLPAPIASRSWRAFSSATWVRTPNSASAIPKRTTRWMAHQCARSGGRCNERQPSPRHSGQAVSRQAQQALGGQGGERSGARTRECVLRSMPAASVGGRGGARRGDRCGSARPRCCRPATPSAASLCNESSLSQVLRSRLRGRVEAARSRRAYG
jgi:hypothetical protein